MDYYANIITKTHQKNFYYDIYNKNLFYNHNCGEDGTEALYINFNAKLDKSLSVVQICEINLPTNDVPYLRCLVLRLSNNTIVYTKCDFKYFDPNIHEFNEIYKCDNVGIYSIYCNLENIFILHNNGDLYIQYISVTNRYGINCFKTELISKNVYLVVNNNRKSDILFLRMVDDRPEMCKYNGGTITTIDLMEHTQRIKKILFHNNIAFVLYNNGKVVVFNTKKNNIFAVFKENNYMDIKLVFRRYGILELTYQSIHSYEYMKQCVYMDIKVNEIIKILWENAPMFFPQHSYSNCNHYVKITLGGQYVYVDRLYDHYMLNTNKQKMTNGVEFYDNALVEYIYDKSYYDELEHITFIPNCIVDGWYIKPIYWSRLFHNTVNNNLNNMIATLLYCLSVRKIKIPYLLLQYMINKHLLKSINY